MSILWCGGEDIDFPGGDGVAADTNAGRWRTGYARCAVNQAANKFGRSTTFQGGAVTSAWITARLSLGSAWQTVGATVFGFACLHGTNKGLYFGNVNGIAKYAIYKYDGTSFTLLASEAGTSVVNSALVRLDFHVVDFGALATVDVYLDGVPLITYTGDVRVTGMTNFDTVIVCRAPLTAGNWGSLSEVIVSDTDTRALSLATLAPSGNGDANTFTSGTYAAIDEVALSDADVAYAAAAGQNLQVALSDLPTFDGVVRAVAVKARLMDGVGGLGMQIGVRTNGATHVGDAVTLTGAYGTYENYFAQNPETLAPFTQTEANALQAAFTSASV